jgi:hypothetical protein
MRPVPLEICTGDAGHRVIGISFVAGTLNCTARFSKLPAYQPRDLPIKIAL